jgi:hypothetical protein
VVAVGDDHLAVNGVAHQQQWRERLAGLYFLAVAFDAGVADAQQGQAGGAKNVLGLEAAHRGLAQFVHQRGSGALVMKQAQVGERRRVIVLFGLSQPFYFCGRHGRCLSTGRRTR